MERIFGPLLRFFFFFFLSLSLENLPFFRARASVSRARRPWVVSGRRAAPCAKRADWLPSQCLLLFRFSTCPHRPPLALCCARTHCLPLLHQSLRPKWRAVKQRARFPPLVISHPGPLFSAGDRQERRSWGLTGLQGYVLSVCVFAPPTMLHVGWPSAQPPVPQRSTALSCPHRPQLTAGCVYCEQCTSVPLPTPARPSQGCWATAPTSPTKEQRPFSILGFEWGMFARRGHGPCLRLHDAPLQQPTPIRLETI